MKTQEHLSDKLKSLPGLPGVYRFYNSKEQLIYVGKAKNLKKRVSSYFSREKFENAKTRVLVRNISDISYIVVESELDALLLENNLIKKHQPRYNVMLKDDKTYPWICIKNERFPRVFSTRKTVKDGSEYYGPYASVRMINTLLELIRELFKLRTCNLNLSEENINAKKFKVCLEFQIGNCLGPCEGLQTEKEYNDSVNQVKQILKGNINSVIDYLSGLMNDASAAFDYEKAQDHKERIGILEKYKSKSVVVNPKIHNVDVFSFKDRGKMAFVNFLRVKNGAIIQSFTLELKKKLDEPSDELLSLAITDIWSRYQSDTNEVIVGIDPYMNIPGVTFTLPKIGDKRHLLQLSEKNLFHYIKDHEAKMERVDPGLRSERILGTLQKDLRLKDLPVHIECFDNSNTQGKDPVSAMSVFRDARPSKKDYRHFNIKTVAGPDDFASMTEVIGRRYRRLIEEGKELPQLIVVDGGKGQLNAAIKSLKDLGIYGKVSVIGIAKKLEEIYFPDDPVPIYLDKKGESLRIIQQLRDEAHRFGITHHRKKREKRIVNSELEEIKGVGSKTISSLLKHFRSVKKIREADLEDLEEVIGKKKAGIIFSYFKK